VRIREILVRTAEEAERHLQQIRRGVDLNTLVQTHTIRPGGRQNQGILRVRLLDKNRYGEELVNAAFGAQVGEFVGPIQAKGGYSIFEVIDKLDAQPKLFDNVRRQAQAFVRKEKENALFQGLVSRLREKFSWQIFDDRLEQVVVHWEVTDAIPMRTDSAAMEIEE
jgi:parvulin-like peptidyl-prolyl isomerase